MSLNKSTILVDAAMNLTGISDDSMRRVKKMIKENILADNNIKLSFDKNNQSAMLKQLDVVYDKVNNIKKMTANLNIGGTDYKMQIDDYTENKKEVLKQNTLISKQEEKINTLKSKGRRLNVQEKSQLEDEKRILQTMVSYRERLAKPMIKDTSLTGADRYSSANLNTSAVTSTKSSTKLSNDEKLLNEQYEQRAYLIKNISKASTQGAVVTESQLKDELALLDKLSAKTVARIKKNNSVAVSTKIIGGAQKKVDMATNEANINEESAAVKARTVALNSYKNTLRELEKAQTLLYKAEAKYKGSVLNQTPDADAEISERKRMVSALQTEAAGYKELTGVKNKGDKSSKVTKEYADALEAEAKYVSNTKAAHSQANKEYAKSSNLLGILNENFKTAAGRIIDYTLVYRSLWMVMNKAKQAIQTIIELNKAFTDIQMVTGYTSNQIKELEKTYSSMAIQLGTTVTEVANAATEWLRQGKSVADTNELLTQSMILSKTGAMESATATERLTSTLNGYKMSVEDASRVVDVFSKLDMITASSANELAVAFTKTANSANDAGIPFENLAGLIATVSETTRKSATTINKPVVLAA